MDLFLPTLLQKVRHRPGRRLLIKPVCIAPGNRLNVASMLFQRKCYDKGCTLAFFAFGRNVSAMPLYNFFYITKGRGRFLRNGLSSSGAKTYQRFFRHIVD